MRIVLLRHAIAEESAPGGDAARALTAEGRKRAEAICAAIAGMDLGIQKVLSSPLVRARQTAQILRDALKIPKAVEETPTLVPEGRPADVCPAISAAKVDCVALVGHEPMLSRFIGFAVGGGTLELRKCGVAVIEGAGLPAGGAGTLVALFAPRHIRPLI